MVTVFRGACRRLPVRVRRVCVGESQQGSLCFAVREYPRASAEMRSVKMIGEEGEDEEDMYMH